LANVVTINGAKDDLTLGVTLLLYYGGVMYYEDVNGLWYQEAAQASTTWNLISGDPRLTNANLIYLPGGTSEIFLPNGSALAYPGSGGGPLPGQVTGVTATTSASLITVSWTAVAGSNVTYTVFGSLLLNGTYTQLGGGGVVGTIASYIIAAGTWYVEVQAVNVGGAGPISSQYGPYVVTNGTPNTIFATTKKPVSSLAGTFTTGTTPSDVTIPPATSIQALVQGTTYTVAVSSGSQVLINGVADPTSSNVNLVLYHPSSPFAFDIGLYYQNTSGTWFQFVPGGPTGFYGLPPSRNGDPRNIVFAKTKKPVSSVAGTFTTGTSPGIVGSITATSPDPTNLTVTWTAPTGASPITYYVYMSNSQNGTYVLVGTVTSALTTQLIV
jgi:hypothetical protein